MALHKKQVNLGDYVEFNQKGSRVGGVVIDCSDTGWIKVEILETDRPHGDPNLNPVVSFHVDNSRRDLEVVERAPENFA